MVENKKQKEEKENTKDKERDVFFFNDAETTEIYTLTLHDALPIFLFYV